MDNNISSSAELRSVELGKLITIGSNSCIKFSKINNGCEIGIGCYLDNVVLEENVVIGNYSELKNCIIKKNAIIGSYVSLGNDPQSYVNKASCCNKTSVVIGENVVVREYCSVNKGFSRDTIVGNDSYLMARSHVDHDCILEERVVLSTGCILGGYVQILKGANLGMGTVVHQNSTIGHFSMIAANTAVVKDVPPFAKLIQGKRLLYNKVIMQREFPELLECVEQNNNHFKKRMIDMNNYDKFMSGCAAYEEKTKNDFFRKLYNSWLEITDKDRSIYA